METTNLMALLVSTVLYLIVCLAMWNKAYPDTLVQRMGLALTAIGSIFVHWAALHDKPLTNPLLWTLAGCAVFALGTLIKRVLAHRAGKEPS